MKPWPSHHRESARAFLAIVSPHHPAILVSNIEDLMPAKFREAFEALFAKLVLTPITADEVKQALEEGGRVRAAAEKTRKRSPRR